MAAEPQIQLTIVEGNDRTPYTCSASDTVLDLKKKIEEEEAVDPTMQFLYSEAYWIRQDEAVLGEFLETGDELVLTLPVMAGKAATFNNDGNEDVWLFHGHKSNPVKALVPKKKEVSITVESNKFALVYHTEGNEEGSRKYQLFRYSVKKEGKIVFRKSGNQLTVHVDDLEVVGEHAVYDEASIPKKDLSKMNMAKIGYYILMLTSRIADFALA